MYRTGKFKFVLAILLSFAATADAYEYDANDFGCEVVSYTQGGNLGFDVIYLLPPAFNLVYYNQSDVALGAPYLMTTGDEDITPDVTSDPESWEWLPVVPVYPAWRTFEVVTIGSGGEIVLKFNHPVGNDLNNPYGIDLIIFGNARFHIENGVEWMPDADPETVTVNGIFAEQGFVSVSQDGQTWYEFTEGPYADDYFPTASYEWDEVDDVWSDELDPTQPVNPALNPVDMAGWSIAEVIGAYEGSAGGTGFDIAQVGLDWIQYVKITDNPASSKTTEIDAVADVSCCGDYKVGNLNGDGQVDLFDFALFARTSGDMQILRNITNNWLQCNWNCQ